MTLCVCAPPLPRRVRGHLWVWALEGSVHMGGCHRHPASHEGDPLCTPCATMAMAVCLLGEGVCALTHGKAHACVCKCVVMVGLLKPPPQETWVCMLSGVYQMTPDCPSMGLNLILASLGKLEEGGPAGG